MIKLYGIRNCSTIKKTIDWFNQNNVAFEFIDYKKTPATEQLLTHWASLVGWEILLNTRGTTWRALPLNQRSSPTLERAIQIMQAHPSAIKRPVIEIDKHLIVGFDITQLQSLTKDIANEQ